MINGKKVFYDLGPVCDSVGTSSTDTAEFSDAGTGPISSCLGGTFWKPKESFSYF